MRTQYSPQGAFKKTNLKKVFPSFICDARTYMQAMDTVDSFVPRRSSRCCAVGDCKCETASLRAGGLKGSLKVSAGCGYEMKRV